MNTSAEVILRWGDSEYPFALKARQLEQLERECDAGIGVIAARVFAFKPFFKDIQQTILLGLIGGGMPPVVARQKMDTFFDGQPLASPRDPSSPLKTATAILQAVFFGIPEVAEPGEARAGESPATKPTSQGSEQPSSNSELIPDPLGR